MSEYPEFVTIREVARRGIMPEHVVRRLVSDGTVPSFKSGNRYYLRVDRLLDAVERTQTHQAEVQR